MDEKARVAAIRLAWSKGKLDYMKLPLQRKFDEDFARAMRISRTFWLESSRRSTKSCWGYEKLNEVARAIPGSRWFFVAPVAKGLESYIEAVRAEVLKDCPLDLRPKLNANKLIDKFPNGSIIMFAGSDNKTYNHLRGNKFDGGIIDEGGFHADLKILVDDILLPATFDTKGFIIGISTTPDELDHPWNTYFDQAILGGYGAHYTIWDTHYPKDQIEGFAIEMARSAGVLKQGMTREEQVAAGMKTTSWRREMMCERVVDEEKLIIPEWKQEYVMEWKDPVFWQFYHKYEALDSGASIMDFTAGGLAHYDFKKGWLVIEDEVGPYKGEEVRTDWIAMGIRAAEERRGYREVYRRVADNNNKILIQDLAGIHKLPFTPARKDDLIAMVNQARLWVGAGRVRVHPRCKYLIGCLKNGIWNKNRDDWAHTMTWGHFDALAWLIYMIRTVDVVTNPIPRDFGITADHHVPPGQVVGSQNYEAMKQVLKLEKPMRTTDDWRRKAMDPKFMERFFKKPSQ